MTEKKEELTSAINAFRNFPQRQILLNELKERLAAARKIHETVTDVTIPCQHRWAQGKVSGMSEFLNLLEGDLR
jgi:hypothetical protein